MVTRTLIGGESVPNQNGGDLLGDSQLYVAVPVASPIYPSWVQANTVGDGNAQWISWDASTGVGYSGDNENNAITNDGTSYVYTDTFTVTGAGNASFAVSGALVAADNVITGISLTYDGGAVNVPVTFTDNSLSSTNYYHVPSTFSAYASGLFQSSSSQTFTLTVDVINWDGSRFDTPDGTGLLLDGTGVTVTPLPAAAWGGLLLLVCVGGMKMYHKRFAA